INEDLDIVHIRGRTGPYFEPMPGAPSFNILRLARPELHVDLRRALHEAKASNERVSLETRLTEEGKTRAVKIEVLPVIEPATKSRCSLVLFHEPKPRRETPEPETATPVPSGARAGDSARALTRQT